MKNRFEKLKNTHLPRFWDTELEEMVYPKYQEFRPKICYIITTNGNKWDWPLDLMLLKPRFIPMRPSDIGDTIGQLIYEKDIIRFGGEIYEIEFRDGCFWISNKDYSYELHTIFGQGELKKTGNLHENPELRVIDNE